MRPFLFLATALALSATEPLRFASGPGHVALLELYTSEGCSSCPPAERWLGALRDDPGLWRDFVPVAFHVDYWNRLGWPDRFSTRAFTQRQYALAAAWGGGSVYTPCFVRDGAEWHPSEEAVPRDAPAANEHAGTLTLVLGDGMARAEFLPAPARVQERFELHIALLGGSLVSKVTAGENAGATLQQEFVALALATHLLVAEGSSHRTEFSLPPPTVTDAGRRALAAWVTRQGALAPIQATGGWLP